LTHLRRPPPPPRPAPPRDAPMLDEPRELLVRALFPLKPPDPLPRALGFGEPPPLETLRSPTRSPPPPRLELLSLTPPPLLRAPESLPPALRSLPPCWLLRSELRSLTTDCF